MDNELDALIKAVETDPSTIALKRTWERQLRRRDVIKYQHGPWDVECLVEEREYGSEPIAMHIAPHGVPRDDHDKWPAIQFLPDGTVLGTDTPPLTRRQLRDIPLGPDVIPRSVINPEKMKAEGVKLPKPLARGKHRPDSFYAQVAALYVAACERGDRAPRVTVARQLSTNGAPYTSVSIRNFRKEAERRGLITPTRQGRPGGQLTARAHKLLKSDPT